MLLPAHPDRLNADELRCLLIESQAKIAKLTYELAYYKWSRPPNATEKLPYSVLITGRASPPDPRLKTGSPGAYDYLAYKKLWESGNVAPIPNTRNSS